MDPPYRGVCGNRDQRYLPKIDHDEFCEELSNLNDRNIMFAVSYDGRTGAKTYGDPLPGISGTDQAGNTSAGRSTQATLLGRSEMTYESLYLSSALASSLKRTEPANGLQLTLL